jgi:hypothetical protein
MRLAILGLFLLPLSLHAGELQQERVGDQTAAKEITGLLENFKGAELTAFQLKPTGTVLIGDPDVRTHLYGKPVLAERKVERAETAAMLQALLAKPESYGYEGKGNFRPSLAFKMEKNSKSLEVLVCFTSGWVSIHKGPVKYFYALTPDALKGFHVLEEYCFPELVQAASGVDEKK